MYDRETTCCVKLLIISALSCVLCFRYCLVMRRSTVVAISLGACQSFCYWINLWDLASSSNAFMASSVGGLVSGTRPGKRPDTVAESSFNPSSLGLALGITQLYPTRTCVAYFNPSFLGSAFGIMLALTAASAAAIFKSFF